MTTIGQVHLMTVCRFGQGEDCCAFLMIGGDGPVCAKGSNIEPVIRHKLNEGTTHAKGDNCGGWRWVWLVGRDAPVLRCAGCQRRPAEIEGYVDYLEAGETADDYVTHQEGTLDLATGAFLCDVCYLICGMPTAHGRRWTATPENLQTLAAKIEAARQRVP